MTRPSWGTYFASLARMVATRATCPRLSVGAVVVRDSVILSTGYNGVVSGAPHCSDTGCVLVDGHCSGSVHAELNALLQAARLGVRLQGSTAYVTHRPCWGCVKAMHQAGVQVAFFETDYGSPYPARSPIAVVQFVPES